MDVKRCFLIIRQTLAESHNELKAILEKGLSGIVGRSIINIRNLIEKFMTIKLLNSLFSIVIEIIFFFIIFQLLNQFHLLNSINVLIINK